MIMIESELFTQIATALREQYPGIYVTGEYVNQPPAFPAVYLIEMDNSVYTPGVDSGDIENYANVMYQVDVYSNKHMGRKAECREIMDFIDNRMAAFGFTRNILTPIPNMADATIFRLTARYRGIADKNHNIYGR